MLRISRYIYVIFTALILASCEKETDSSLLWGKTDYYENFLFYKYEAVKMTKTLCFETNEDAKGRVGNVKLGIYKMEENGSFIPVKDDIILYKNDSLCVDNTLLITPHDNEVKLGIEFTPNAEEGVHKWFLKILDNGNFDRINEFSVEEEAMPLLLEWKAEKNDIVNPLALGLIWMGIVILVVTLLWFLILKSIMFPTFKIGNIQFVSGSYFASKKIRGARKLIVTSSSKKRQSALNRLFTGKIIYERNVFWTDEWELYPKGKGARLITNRKYTITPFTTSLEKQNEYQIEHLESNVKAQITLM